ncbi:Serine/threonine kinase [Minicystis rosea]|nr:Serine/threonine kinase [Minicystis rosea]
MTALSESLRDGRYRLVGVLGEGAQGTTFDAVDTKTGLAVAVKRFRVRGARSWKDVELAEREAAVVAKLSHPMLPRHVEHFEEAGELFLVTEKIEGESLAARRRRGLAFDEGDVIRLLHDAADVLRYLHGRTPPIVHRDLKPSNILRRPDGSFAFIDFGAVRDRMKPEGGSTVVGTFGYMAPEQFQGRATAASDVYAIGATALSLLTGREPEDLPHVGLGIDVPRALEGSGVRAELVELLADMLEPMPEKRATFIDVERLAGSSTREAHGAPASCANPGCRNGRVGNERCPVCKRGEEAEPTSRLVVLLCAVIGLATYAAMVRWSLGVGERVVLGALVLFIIYRGVSAGSRARKSAKLTFVERKQKASERAQLTRARISFAEPMAEDEPDEAHDTRRRMRR